MNDFRQDNRSRENRSSFGRRFGGRDTGRREMHDAVCDNCGKNCQIPFRPSGDKPVYCSDCFEKKGGRDGDRPQGRSSFGRDSHSGGATNRPISNFNEQAIQQLSKNIETLNTKLDSIISLLSTNKSEEALIPVKKVTEKKVETSKTKLEKPEKKEKAAKTIAK